MIKHLLIFCLLVSTSIGSYGQAKLSNEKINSLKKTVKDPKASITNRFKALDEMIKADVLGLNIDTLRLYGNLCIEVGKQEKNTDLQAAGIGMMGIAYSQEQNLDKADSCYNLGAEMLTNDSDPWYRIGSLINRGILRSDRGLSEQAIEMYKEAIEIADQHNLLKLRVSAELNLAGLLSRRGDLATGVTYFTRSLATYEQLGDSSGMANALSNIGSCNQMLGDLDNSRDYFKRAALLFKKTNHPNLPRPLLNLGSTYTGLNSDSLNKYTDLAIEAAEKFGDYTMQAVAYVIKAQDLELKSALDEADKCLNTAMALASKANNPLYMTEVKIRISRIKGLKGDHRGAIKLAEEALVVGEQMGDNPLQRNALSSLVLQYKAMGMHEKALEYYERQIELEAELKNKENERQLIKQEYAYNYEKEALADSLSFAAQKEIQTKEIQRQKTLRNGFIGGFVLVAMFAGVFFYQRKRIGREKQRSEELLLNILPEEVAEELKQKGAAEAQLIDHVTVLFTDFKGFTAMSEKLSPKDLVNDLNICFSEFDKIMEEHNIEKIKTIGDAYMAAGGLPTPNDTHASDVVKAAFKMRDFVEAGKAEKIAKGLPYFEIRIGIHTGPVVAGIVGVKKFQYDIWGDTVNTASRMESSGEVGKVNISQSTYELLKDDPQFTFESRGKIEAKGKGEMEMVFVSLKKSKANE